MARDVTAKDDELHPSGNPPPTGPKRPGSRDRGGVAQCTSRPPMAMGNFGGAPSFFTLPPMFLTGAGVAAAVGMISSISNLGGFLGPYLIGALKDTTGGYTAPCSSSACLA